MLRHSFPLYRQLDARDCGPACLRMVAAWYGKDFPLAELRDLAGVDREGVSVEGLIGAARSIQLESLPVQLALRDDPGLLDAPLPCILHWEQRHFVVLYRIHKGHYYIADPAKGRMRLGERAFLSKWLDGQEKGIALLLEPGVLFSRQTTTGSKSLDWRFIWNYLSPYKALFRQLILGLVVLSGIQLALPFITKAIVDIGISNRDIGLVWILLIGQLVLVLGQTSALFFQNWIFLHLGTRFNLSLLSTFLQKLMRLPLRFFDQRLMGDLLNRIQDHKRIELFVTQSSMSLLLSGFQLLVFGTVLALFHFGIFLIFFLSSLLYFGWLILFWNQRRLIDADRFEKNSENQHALIELIQGMPEIKLQGSDTKRRWKWAQIQADLYKVNLRGLRISQLQDGGTTLIAQLKDIFILLVAALAVIEGRMSLGSLLAIQFIVGQLNLPLQQITLFLRRAQDARISFERFGEIHQLPDEDPGGSEKIWSDGPGNIEGRGISFAYTSVQEPVLKEIDFSIPAGKVTAIVGNSGSGKTTLLKLLLGFYQPGSGTLLLDEVPLSSMNKAWWRSQCGAVLQDGFLFSDTIANNIAESTDVPDPIRLKKAIELASLEDYIRQLPNGLNTRIGAQGNGLSQGQRQRLLIARAVYKNPRFLFFDEATNALDANNERSILDHLRQFYTGRTVLVVAHRLSTVKDADQILVMADGRIIESGTHQTLLEKQGEYYELVRNQLEING
ncbi:MAG: peptidase domain-containing ABC transporter [Saprospiraceae bacterium]|nr:peptidase domain-containing ABC transporter [Saprospiraceae bacterium]